MREFRASIAGSGERLLERVETAISVWQRFRGLMMRRDLPAGRGLLFPSCNSVHTCFMRFPIDLIYLSQDNHVVKIVPAVRPWRLSACRRARSILEAPCGSAERAGLQVGDTLLFDFAEEGCRAGQTSSCLTPPPAR
jgi:uncharacterized membrane protein (UPF0127 family)